MSLIDFDTKVNEKLLPANVANSLKENGSLRFISESSNKNLEQAIGKIADGDVIHFDTEIGWTPHELLMFILSKTGKAKVYIATWAIKEYPAQVIVSALHSGLIDEINLRLDYRIKTTCPNAFHLLKNNAVSLIEAYCHAKITVIENDNWGVTIVGSANYSKNPRGEAGVITVSKKVAAMRIRFIQNKISNDGMDGTDID